MGLAIDESEEVENSTEVINRSSRLRKKPRDFAETPIDQEIGKTDNDRSRAMANQMRFALIAERLVTMFPTIARSRGTRMFDDSCGTQDDPTQTILQKVPNQCCPLQIERNPISRGLDDRRSPLQCAKCTNVATGFRCHIPCDPEHRIVFELFGRRQWHSSKWQWARVHNRRDRRGSHSIAE